MEPFEIMISESQERMLCVVEPERVDEVVAVCEKWLVNATAIGEVTDTRRLRVFDGDALVGDMPVTALVDECPALRPRAGRAARSRCTRRPSAVLERPLDARRDRCSRCSAAPNLASRRWAFEQYDCLVGSRTVRRPEQADAAVLALAERLRARRLDRRQRPARRLRPVPRRGRGGARVLGQPRLRRRRAARADQLPELRQPGEAPRRLAAHARGGRPRPTPAARSAIPVVGGNVSLYNEARRGPDLPDPGRRAGRRAAEGRALGPARLRARRATSSRVISARSWAPALDRLRAGEAARRGAVRRAPAGRPRRAARAARRRPPGACERARCAPPTTSPRAGSRSRWRSAAWRAAWARASTSRRCAVARRGAAVRRGPGRVRGLRARSRCARSAARRWSSARSAATPS